MRGYKELAVFEEELGRKGKKSVKSATRFLEMRLGVNQHGSHVEMTYMTVNSGSQAPW